MNKQTVALTALCAGWTLAADTADATTYEDDRRAMVRFVTDYVFALPTSW